MAATILPETHATSDGFIIPQGLKEAAAFSWQLVANPSVKLKLIIIGACKICYNRAWFDRLLTDFPWHEH